MTKDNATPRPWRLYAPDRPLKEFIDVCIEKSPDHQNYEARIITNIDNANDPEYRILCILGNGPKADANAHLIVEAVNNYSAFIYKMDKDAKLIDELVEALKEIANSGCCLTPGCSIDDPMCMAMTAKQALSKAESEPIK